MKKRNISVEGVGEMRRVVGGFAIVHLWRGLLFSIIKK